MIKGLMNKNYNVKRLVIIHIGHQIQKYVVNQYNL